MGNFLKKSARACSLSALKWQKFANKNSNIHSAGQHEGGGEPGRKELTEMDLLEPRKQSASLRKQPAEGGPSSMSEWKARATEREEEERKTPLE